MFVKIAALATLSLLLGAGGLAKPQANNKVLNENRTITPLADRTQMTDLNLTEDSFLVKNWKVYESHSQRMALCDGDLSTYLWLHDPQENSYIEFNLGDDLVEIYDITVCPGESSSDWLREGYWTWSNNKYDFMSTESFRIDTKQDATIKTYGIKANRLRLYGVDSGGYWAQISEIKINQGTYDNDGEIQRIEFHGFGRSYFPKEVVNIETGYNNIVDGNPSTYARTDRPEIGDYIEFEWKDNVEFKNIQYQNAKIDSTTDRVYGAKIQYFDGTEWQEAMSDPSEYFNDGYAKQILDLSNSPITTKLLRFVITDSQSWSTVGDFYFNDLTISTTVDSELVYGSLGNMIDGDLDTSIWYDWKVSPNKYFELSYPKGVEVSSIYFLQQAYRYDVGDVNSDMFHNLTIQYGVDAEHLISSEEFVDTVDVFKTFETPLQNIKIIRFVYTGDGPSSYGVVVRECGINYVKHDVKVRNWVTEADYTGSPINGYDKYSFDSGINVTYKQGEDTLAGAPTNPGLYSITMSTSGNSVYNAYNETKSFHVYDSSTHFISEWEDKIVAGLGGNVCNQFGEGDNVLKQLIRIYDNHIKAADKETVDAHTYKDSRGITVSIADTIAYAKAHIEEFGGSNSLNINLNNSQTGVISIVVVVAATLSVTALFFLISKKKKHQ